jgi:hypothetical protein
MMKGKAVKIGELTPDSWAQRLYELFYLLLHLAHGAALHSLAAASLFLAIPIAITAAPDTPALALNKEDAFCTVHNEKVHFAFGGALTLNVLQSVIHPVCI